MEKHYSTNSNHSQLIMSSSIVDTLPANYQSQSLDCGKQFKAELIEWLVKIFWKYVDFRLPLDM